MWGSLDLYGAMKKILPCKSTKKYRRPRACNYLLLFLSKVVFSLCVATAGWFIISFQKCIHEELKVDKKKLCIVFQPRQSSNQPVGGKEKPFRFYFWTWSPVKTVSAVNFKDWYIKSKNNIDAVCSSIHFMTM